MRHGITEQKSKFSKFISKRWRDSTNLRRQIGIRGLNCQPMNDGRKSACEMWAAHGGAEIESWLVLLRGDRRASWFVISVGRVGLPFTRLGPS